MPGAKNLLALGPMANGNISAAITTAHWGAQHRKAASRMHDLKAPTDHPAATMDHRAAIHDPAERGRGVEVSGAKVWGRGGGGHRRRSRFAGWHFCPAQWTAESGTLEPREPLPRAEVRKRDREISGG